MHIIRVIALWMHFILQNLAAICTVLVCPMNQKKESINTAPDLCVINEHRMLYSEFTLSVTFSKVGQCFLFSIVSETKDMYNLHVHHSQLNCQFIYIDHFQLCLKSRLKIKHDNMICIYKIFMFYFWNVFETVDYYFEIWVN